MTPPVSAFGPCSSCPYQEGCAGFEALKVGLYSQAKYKNPPVLSTLDFALGDLAATWFKSVKTLLGSGAVKADELGLTVSALFDLAASGLYASALLYGDSSFFDEKGRTRIEAMFCGKDALFPHTWMCPLCVAGGKTGIDAYLPGFRSEDVKGDSKKRRFYPIKEKLAKPKARAIGDAGISIVKAILRTLLPAADQTSILREGGARSAQFDLTITTDSQILLLEVKAKPLIAYPLLVEGVRPNGGDHTWTRNVESLGDGLSFYLAGIKKKLPIKPTFSLSWPFDSLIEAAQSPEMVAAIFHNWRLHYEGYCKWTGEPKELRWHRFGCGNFSSKVGDVRTEYRVANTKELPGLDRTDDIKKGTAQALLFARFKLACQKDAVRTGLMGNLYAETHRGDYVDPLKNLRIFRAGEPEGQDRWLYDAIIGFSRDHINSEDVRPLVSAEVLITNMG